MQKKPVITVIGAASITFGPKMLRDIINFGAMEGCIFRFIDIHAEHLEIYAGLVKKVSEESGREISVQYGTDRTALLPGSDFVVVSVETNHHDLWEEDFRVPVSLGSRQVTGELGGPGGLFHTLRQIPLHLDIARDIRWCCPDAMVMVCSNPLNRICLAMQRHGELKNVVGLCHGVEITENFFIKHVLDDPSIDLQTTAAGTNHFTWVLALEDLTSGRDLYPEFRKKLAAYDPAKSPLTRKMFEVFGYIPACGDGHFGEYLPYAWEMIGLEGPPFDVRRENEENRWEYFARLVNGKATVREQRQEADDDEELMLKELNGPRSWVDTLVIPIIASMVSGEERRMPAVNLLNEGVIPVLPEDVFVEVPAVAGAGGLTPQVIDEMPRSLAAFNRRDIDQMELAVEAAVSGDRNLILQAMMLDPVTDSIGNAERIIDEMLKRQERYLPQFA